ncbi:trypsin-like serine protease [Brevibacterium album]|uniref:trypsin-like serine protease n=1 Tax=Brevibacterium album TaxID=417948 RepID=UPI00041A0F33|nr:LPXTG cell wall anchor domain-containing protein [Brevibacterium album]
MARPMMGKRAVALSAAVALGFGGALVAAPVALATPTADEAPESYEVAALTALKHADTIAAVGKGEGGQLVVQTTDATVDEESTEVESVVEFAEADNGTPDEIVVEHIDEGYSAVAANDTDVVNGAGYRVSMGGGFGLCSIGFNAVGPDGKDAIITAGHCGDGMIGNDVHLEAPSTSNVATDSYNTSEQLGDKRLGEFTHTQYGPATAVTDDLDPADAQDFGIIEVDEASGFNMPGEVTQWTEAAYQADDLASDAQPVNGVLDVEQGHIGQTVYHSGRTTGKTEGVIDFVDGYANVRDDAGNPHIVYGFGSTAEVAGGDSGGAVMLGDQAVGVVSGGGPGVLWTAELHEGLKHLPGDYTVKTAGDEPSPTPTDTETPSPTPSETETAEPTETPDPTPSETETAEPTQTATPTDEPTQTATPTEEPEELRLSETEVEASKFVADGEEQAEAEDRGVVYTVTGAEPGSEVTFETFMDGQAAAAKSVTVTVDENGVAGSRIWGLTTAAPEAYIGEYDVVATTSEDVHEAGFSVVADSDGGNGGEDDNGNGDDLPRTGSTTGPLVAGAAGLLAVGGALVYIARRRNV